MSILSKSNKPSRAERKADKKAQKEAARQALIDARELAREEKRAARAARSWFGRKRKGDEDLDEAVGFDVENTEPFDLPEFQNVHPDETSRLEEIFLSGEGDEHSEPDLPAPAPSQPLVLDEPVKPELLSRPRIKRKAKKSTRTSARKEPALAAIEETGTKIRPVVHPGAANTGSPADAGSPGQSFATLRDVVDGERARHAPDDILVLNDPLPEPANSLSGPLSGPVTSARKIDPLRPPGLTDQIEPAQTPAPATEFCENWLGLWVSEDGEAIYIEEDGEGWYAITVLPDPTTTCYAGPDYPEIQSYRMPASWSQDEVGEFNGERLSAITVPGLPDTHRSPMMYIYFLASIAAAEGGGNRFATVEDRTRRVFIVADFETGTVNPWSDHDDIEWIDPSVNYYKAPGKLDAYMMRRMETDDPLND